MYKVSVVIPTFNRAHTIERAIISVLEQSFQNFELIVVDDGSTDNTKFLLAKYPKVKYIYQENKGVSSARNTGIENAIGEYIALLDSDDEWLPQKLANQVGFMNDHPEFLWMHTEEIWIRSGVRVNQMKKNKKGGGDQFIASLNLCLISPSTVLVHRSLFDRYKFREDFEVCEDFDMWLKLLADYPVGFIAEPQINKYGGHEDQLSIKYFAMDIYRIKSIHWVLNNLELSDIKKHKASEIFTKKYEILKKGALKHSNQKLLNQLNQLHLVS